MEADWQKRIKAEAEQPDGWGKWGGFKVKRAAQACMGASPTHNEVVKRFHTSNL